MERNSTDITTRHIRHDWYIWDDISKTKEVKSLCRTRTKDEFVGIPGITEQDAVVITPAGEKPGWCYPCCVQMSKQLKIWFDNYSSGKSKVHPSVVKCYEDAADILLEIRDVYSNWTNDWSLSGAVMQFDPADKSKPYPVGHKYNRNSANPLYRIWSGMLARCYAKQSPNYKNYGGRGIGVDQRWHTFKNFADDMFPRPHGMSLERIDNDGDYGPLNCKWATSSEQARNRRITRMDTPTF